MTRTEIIALIVVITIAMALIFPTAGGLLLRFLGAIFKVIAVLR